MIEPTRSAAPLCVRSAVPSRGQNRSLAGYSVLQVEQIFSALTYPCSFDAEDGFSGVGRAGDATSHDTGTSSPNSTEPRHRESSSGTAARDSRRKSAWPYFGFATVQNSLHSFLPVSYTHLTLPTNREV